MVTAGSSSFDCHKKGAAVMKVRDYTTSLVMPVFNGSHDINAALSSVARQTWAIDEIVVVDDGSSDNTVAVLELWVGRLPLKILKNEENRGVGYSLRRGVKESRGDLIFRLDADDIWQENHVESMIILAEAQPMAVLFSSEARYINDAGIDVGGSPKVNAHKIKKLLMWDNPLVHSATAFRREAYNRVGGYPVGFRWEDYALWIELMKVGALAYNSSYTVRYLVSDRSISRQKWAVAFLARWQCQRRSIRAFWSEAPFVALVCYAVGSVRYFFANVRG